jgi:iron uptake system component EfeO
VSKSKITGEEERYSHTDLDDFKANVEGAQAAFDAVRQILSATQPALAARIDARFASVASSLEPYRRNERFVPYTELVRKDTVTLSRSVDALAEPLSSVAAVVAAG